MEEPTLTGCFNSNVRLPDGRGLVRRPLPHRWDIPARQFDERTVLQFLGTTSIAAPRVLGEHDDGFVIEFIDGVLLDQVAPSTQPVAHELIDMLAQVLRALHQVDYRELGTPFGDGVATDTQAFAHRLVDSVERFLNWCAPWSTPTQAAYGIPQEPLAALRAIADHMTPRLAALLHVDVHRRNAIVRGDGALALIDWEFALIGDPVFDLARHVLMMEYTAHEREVFLQAYAPHTPPMCIDRLRQQLDGYIAIEIVKEVLVLVAVIAEGTATPATHERLAHILPQAQAIWLAEPTLAA